MTGGLEVQAALCCLLRWGWEPGRFLRLSPGERAFVAAGLIWEKEQQEAPRRGQR